MGYKQFSYVQAQSSQKGDEVGELGYQGEIALLTTKLFSQSHFASLMMDRFHQEMAQAGYALNIHRVNEDNIAKLSLPRTLQTDRISGLICFELFDYRKGTEGTVRCDLFRKP